jgi:hypothetical protein
LVWQHAAALSSVLTSSTNRSIAKWKTTMTRSATKQEKCCAYHLNPIPKHALFNFVQSLPAKERQQPKPAPTDFVQVSRMMADAIWKGMNLSSESKKSGFSNNVEEILKLLTSLRNVCKQLFQEKTKLRSSSYARQRREYSGKQPDLPHRVVHPCLCQPYEEFPFQDNTSFT